MQRKKFRITLQLTTVTIAVGWQSFLNLRWSSILTWLRPFFFNARGIGWESNSPANSCKHIRDAGDSRGDGEYWIDPENKGSPLKVYCDMTTDGGERQMYCGALFSPCWTGQRYEINPSSGVLWHQRLIGILLFEHLKPNDIVLRLTICSKRQGKEMCRLPFASQLPLKYLCAVSESIGKKIVFYFSSLHLSISLLDKNISQFCKTGGVHVLLKS